MNTGAPSTAQTINYGRVAKDLGADAVMIAPPAIPGIPTSLVRQHFLDIAEASDLPIFMQDMTGAAMARLFSQILLTHTRIFATQKSRVFRLLIVSQKLVKQPGAGCRCLAEQTACTSSKR